MAPLKRLFGARNRQPSLDEQIQALENRSESELLALVQSDTQEALREAALNHLSYNQTLLNLSLGNGKGRLQQAARKRIGQLLEEEHLTLDELGKVVSDEAQLLALSSYSARAGQQVLKQINEPEVLLELAIHGASIQIRRAAAEKITTRAELEQLQKAAQGRDKTVYKLAKQRLEAFKAEDARRAEAEAQALVICQKLEQLLKAENDPQFDAKLDKLQQDWRDLSVEPPEPLKQRYQNAFDAYRQRESERAAEQAQLAAQAEAEAAEKAERRARAEKLEGEIHELRAQLYQATAEQLHEARWDEQLQSLSDSLKALDREVLSDKARSRVEREHARASELLSQLREKGALPDWLERWHSEEADQRQQARQALKQLLKGARQWPDAPEAIATVLNELRQAEEAEQAEFQAQRKQQRELEGLVRQGLSAAQRGQVRRARGLHRASQEKREGVDHVPAHLSGKLEELDQAIERLSDWHEFAVTPKKEALIRSMEALEKSQMNPEELARKIHHLQDDWREVSKGVPHHDEDLWHQFQEASHRAFEPCKEFFEAQAREREANQAKREELIEQVQLYLDGYHWDSPVWKDVEHTLKQARREWRDAWPVPRQAIKAQEGRFEPLMEQLHAKLSEGYEAHRATKEALVARAKELSELSDLQQAIEGAKQLQAQWKEVGQCRPREDQALWKQFRAYCDAIFARRQEQFEAADQERQANADRAQELIAQLKQLEPEAQSGAVRGQIEALKTEFRNLGPLPRAQMEGINDDWQKTLKGLDQKRRQAHSQARERQRQQLFNAAEAVRALELASLEDRGTTAAREEAEIAMEAVEQWPGNSREQLEQRLQHIEDLTPTEQQGNLERLRLLCIRAEILTGRETPEEDKALRMEHQMQQLQQGLGKEQDTAEQLLQEWLSVGGVADPEYSKLLARFQANLED
ncbi:DUF349 domain-containing protein [Marinimicrobium locisalis]|uniref:DUF349 domain-containing protein n=1 Tax=Marinimicrobium locisalis TaxID=546022 RepID=UPI0032218F83